MSARAGRLDDCVGVPSTHVHLKGHHIHANATVQHVSHSSMHSFPRSTVLSAKTRTPLRAQVPFRRSTSTVLPSTTTDVMAERTEPKQHEPVGLPGLDFAFLQPQCGSVASTPTVIAPSKLLN